MEKTQCLRQFVRLYLTKQFLELFRQTFYIFVHIHVTKSPCETRKPVAPVLQGSMTKNLRVLSESLKLYTQMNYLTPITKYIVGCGGVVVQLRGILPGCA